MKHYLDNVNFFELFHNDLPPLIIIEGFYRINNACVELYVPSKLAPRLKENSLTEISSLHLVKAAEKIWRAQRIYHTCINHLNH
jgi:hypothetical protein